MSSSVGESTNPTHKAGPQAVSPDNMQLYDLERHAIESTPTIVDTGSPGEFLDFLQKGGNPSTFIWYDELGNRVGSLALVELEDSDDIEVRNIAVDTDHQRSGFGTAMMAYAEDIAIQSGKNKLTLVTSPDNEPALKFYKGLGYSIVKTVENYYGDGMPRYILEKTVRPFP
jgi:ribosomal protein S18 acetylase RimI-like enzyme